MESKQIWILGSRDLPIEQKHLKFLHRFYCGEWVGIDVVDGVEVEGGRVAHHGGAVAAAADPGKVGERTAVISCRINRGGRS